MDWTEYLLSFKIITHQITARVLGSLDEASNFMNDSVYDFFKFNYGACKSTNQTNENFRKYNDFTLKQLKSELAKLKHQSSALPDIKYVSGLFAQNWKLLLGFLIDSLLLTSVTIT